MKLSWIVILLLLPPLLQLLLLLPLLQLLLLPLLQLLLLQLLQLLLIQLLLRGDLSLVSWWRNRHRTFRSQCIGYQLARDRQHLGTSLQPFPNYLGASVDQVCADIGSTPD